MTAAQTKQHEEEEHTRLCKEKIRKVGSKAKSMKIVLKASMVKLPVSATKPTGGPCHTSCHLLPALVDSGIKCHYCHCRAPPPHTSYHPRRSMYTSTRTWQLMPGTRFVSVIVCTWYILSSVLFVFLPR